MKYFIYMSLFSALLSLYGCGADAVAKLPAVKSVVPVILHSAQYIEFGTNTNKGSKVLTSQASYNLELAKYSSAQAVVLDFTKNKVLLIDMGPRNSGGYSISIVKVVYLTDHVVVYIDLMKPGFGCLTTLAITNPFQFVQVETNYNDVLIKESLITKKC